MENFKITFMLTGRGVIFDQDDPIHLDSLVTYAVLSENESCFDLTRHDIPDEPELPLKKSGIGVYHASALFIDNDNTPEALRYWRKKFNVTLAAGRTAGSPALTNATYREYNTPVDLSLCAKMSAYAKGHMRETLQLLKKHIKHIGKKRAYGYGKVSDMHAEMTTHDSSLVRNEKAMRWLPDKSCHRNVRLVPPYWNPHNRVRCCEVGADYSLIKK